VSTLCSDRAVSWTVQPDLKRDDVGVSSRTDRCSGSGSRCDVGDGGSDTVRLSERDRSESESEDGDLRWSCSWSESECGETMLERERSALGTFSGIHEGKLRT
jgi:hypothetical protein